MDIFKLGDKILALLEVVFGFWNNQISLIFELLGQSPTAFKDGGPWSVISGIEPIFVAVGSSLVVLFFVIGFCSESIDIREEIVWWYILLSLTVSISCSVVFEAVTMALAIIVCNAFISAGLPSFTGDYADWAKTLIYLCEMTFTYISTEGETEIRQLRQAEETTGKQDNDTDKKSNKGQNDFQRTKKKMLSMFGGVILLLIAFVGFAVWFKY